ncbi:MAG: DNA phosphorothioation-associated putative methyltransferase [Verrucomicrobiales bacterium]|nr:DNA phosphorothioation-associated putative methyltransferase [Verrucomicrobiales bacterium]
MNKIVTGLAARYELGSEFNVIKFRTDELKVSFLSYPDFMDEAHPQLRHAVTIDLVTGRARQTGYGQNLNPPILHRKEQFLPEHHPRRSLFEALTRAEESEGLYEQTATIGFKLNWEKMLREKGLRIEEHTLRKAENQTQSAECERTPDSSSGHVLPNQDGPAVVVERHKTAMTRYDLSKPVKTLLEYGLLKSGTTFFDYGCGQGSDVRGLQALGHQADGWDPVYRADREKREADIVNMGYVLNVIEDPAERVEALVEAHRQATKLLVVSGLINETVDTARAKQYSDGVLTRANTFQKFFEQQELQQYSKRQGGCTLCSVAAVRKMAG